MNEAERRKIMLMSNFDLIRNAGFQVDRKTLKLFECHVTNKL